MYRKLIFYILTITPFFALAQKSNPDTLYSYYTEEKISIDGHFTEAAWQKAIRIDNFKQREPEEGKVVSERTYAAMLYNKINLYIGLWAYDAHPEKILAKDMARDGRWGTSDNFEINICTYNDNRNSFLFVVTPSGLRGDALLTDEGKGFNEDWNGVWDVAVQRTDSGWFAEIIIPFSTLKFPDVDIQSWALNIERNIRYKNEQACWQGWSRNYTVFKISQGGNLAGLKNIKGNQLAEFKPFLTAGVQKQAKENLDKTLKYGGDVNISFTPTTKLNLTFNTDFSQVESDRIPVNLSRFSVYMPEKRAFFIENKDLFEFNIPGGLNSFYSRRIGIHNGTEIPILGGVKLSGKEGKTNFGILSMQTSANDSLASVNYSVIRFKQDISAQSNIGFITTALNKKGHYNYMYGIDLNYATSKIFKNKNLQIGASIAQTQTKNVKNTQNLAYQLYINYPNDLIIGNFTMSSVQKGYNPEIGFKQRDNYNLYTCAFDFRPRPKGLPWVKQLSIKPIDISYYVSDDTKTLESALYSIKPLGITNKSGESIALFFQKTFEKLTSDFNIYDTIILPKGSYDYHTTEIQFSTYQSRRIYGTSNFSWGEFFTGKGNKIYVSLCWYPNEHFNITSDWTRYDIHLPQGDFITHDIGSRVEYALTPKLNNSIYGQWNTVSKEVLLNYRINWIPKVGSDFYFVVNQKLSTRGDKIQFGDFTLLAKFIWRIVV